MAAVALAVALASVACFGTPSTSPTAVVSSDAAGVSFAADLAFCVSEVNRYRGLAGVGALARSHALEAYAEAAARTDGLARTPHQHARTTNFGEGLVRAENQIPSWSLAAHQTVRTIIEAGLAQMWAQGPGGSHYQNMVGAYSEIGCGVFVIGNEVTVVQAFR